MRSRHNGYQVNLNFLVLSKITGELPSISVDTTSWEIPRNITLADSSFNVKGKIDLLVGAEVFHQIVCIGRIVLSDELPALQKTKFGWVVSGMQKQSTQSSHGSSSSCSSSHNRSNQSNATYCNHALVITNLEENLSKYSKVESSESVYTMEEKSCEEVVKSIRRDTDDIQQIQWGHNSSDTMRRKVKLFEFDGFQHRSNNQFVEVNVSEDSNGNNSTFQVDDSNTKNSLRFLDQKESKTFRISIHEDNSQNRMRGLCNSIK